MGRDDGTPYVVIALNVIGLATCSAADNELVMRINDLDHQ